MKPVYEAMLWWLVLWLPSKHESFLAYLIFDSYHGKAHENFWDAVAMPRRSNSPWARHWEQHVEFIGDNDD